MLIPPPLPPAITDIYMSEKLYNINFQNNYFNFVASNIQISIYFLGVQALFIKKKWVNGCVHLNIEGNDQQFLFPDLTSSLVKNLVQGKYRWLDKRHC